MNPDRGPQTAGRAGAPPQRLSAFSVTALLTAPALLLALLPDGGAFLQYDRRAIAGGEWWRLLAGHWTHWTADHLLWDVTAFAVLLFACWRLTRSRTITAIALATIAIPAAVWIALPQMTLYRGLSGLDSTLFVLLAVTLLREEMREGDRKLSIAIAIALVGFVGKVIFEMTTGATVFVASGAFAPVPLAHVVGGFCGWLATRPFGMRFAG